MNSVTDAHEVVELRTAAEIADHLARCPRHQTGLGFGPLFVLVPVALHEKVLAQLASQAELVSALEAVLETSGARGTYHALKYTEAVGRAEALLSRTKGDAS